MYSNFYIRLLTSLAIFISTSTLIGFSECNPQDESTSFPKDETLYIKTLLKDPVL